MNARRIASLLRELADAIEAPDPAAKQRLRKRLLTTVAEPAARPAMVERIGRVMRNKGMTG